MNSLSTKRNPIEKSIRGDEIVKLYEYKTGIATGTEWIPGQMNLTKPSAKTDSPLTKALIQTKPLRIICIDLSAYDVRFQVSIRFCRSVSWLISKGKYFPIHD